jgi:acyl-CoA dehydrogenase
VRGGARAAAELAKAVWSAAEALREATEAAGGDGGQRPQRRRGALSARLCPGAGGAFPSGGGRAEAARLPLARFFIERLPLHAADLAHARSGAAGLYEISADDLAA